MKIPLLIAFFLLAATSAQGQYQHLTITADSLVPALAPLCEYLEDHAGLEDTVVTVAQVLSTASGRDEQEKVRNFIKQAYTDWGVTHVLLAADNDQIPCRVCWVEVSPDYRDWIATEMYYSALDGDWDADGDSRFGEAEDSVDLMPDVLLGRLPLATPAEMSAFVDRFMIYVSDSTARYLEDVLLAGFDYSASFKGEYSCEIYDTLLRPATMRAWKVYDSHYPHNHEDSVKTLLDRGMHVWVQYDHCNYNVMGCGYTNHNYLLWTWELDDMANAPNYTIGFAAGCYPSAFDSSYCVAEVLLTAPNGGCVAFCGNTRIGFGVNPDPYRSGSHYYCEKVLEGMWQGPGHGTFGGLAAGQTQAAPLAASSVVWRWCHYEFLLSGEPGMPVWVPEGSGVADERTRPQRQRTSQTVMRGVLVLEAAGVGEGGARLVDAAGRVVTDLLPGENDIRSIAPGVYFVRGEGPGSRIVIAD